MKKLLGDDTLETRVAVYKVGSLARPQHRFKVDVNAQENHMTGAAVVTDSFAVVIVEGGKHASCVIHTADSPRVG